MKTANEWLNVLYSARHGQCEIITQDELQAIQLDAFKAGERFAAGIVLREAPWRSDKEIRDFICDDASTRTTLPEGL